MNMKFLDVVTPPPDIYHIVSSKESKITTALNDFEQECLTTYFPI